MGFECQETRARNRELLLAIASSTVALIGGALMIFAYCKAIDYGGAWAIAFYFALASEGALLLLWARSLAPVAARSSNH